MKELTTQIITKNGNIRIIKVELEDVLADWLVTQTHAIYHDFLLSEYKAKCVERKETRRTQSLDKSLENGFDVKDESLESEEETLLRLTLEQAISRLNSQQQWIVRQLYYVGRKQVDISKELGISKSAMTQQISVIRSALKKILKNFQE